MTTYRMTSPPAGRRSRPGSGRRGGLKQRLQHERDSRLAQLQAMAADQPEEAKNLMVAQAAAIRVVLTEIDAAELLSTTSRSPVAVVGHRR
jgi:DnaK suppressor protein